MLASPRFLFRLEEAPATARAGQNYRIADVDLATRLHLASQSVERIAGAPCFLLLLGSVPEGAPRKRPVLMKVAVDIDLDDARATAGAHQLEDEARPSGEVGAIRLTSYAMCVSTLAVFVQFALLNPIGALRQPTPVYGLSLINGLLCTVLPVFATMLAVERIGAGRTSVAAMVGPVATIVLAYLFLDETISTWQIAGTALVLAGISVLSRSTSAPARTMTKESS